MKKLTMLTVIVLVIFYSFACFAAPDIVYPNDAGNTNSLIGITNPDSPKSNTLEGNYVLAGYGDNGVLVTLYSYDYSIGAYKARQISFTIGASGLFMRQIALNKGKNSLLIRAEDKYGNYQINKIDITLLSSNFLNIIRSITSKYLDLK